MAHPQLHASPVCLSLPPLGRHICGSRQEQTFSCCGAHHSLCCCHCCRSVCQSRHKEHKWPHIPQGGQQQQQQQQLALSCQLAGLLAAQLLCKETPATALQQLVALPSLPLSSLNTILATCALKRQVNAVLSATFLASSNYMLVHKSRVPAARPKA
jgi:hypothetical protein